MKLISIHPANTESGEYDVKQPLPYPFHIEAATGQVIVQELWKGDPASIIGFQDTADDQRVTLLWDNAAKDTASIVGKFPVFVRDNGSVFNLTTPITKATATEVDDHEVP